MCIISGEFLRPVPREGSFISPINTPPFNPRESVCNTGSHGEREVDNKQRTPEAVATRTESF